MEGCKSKPTVVLNAPYPLGILRRARAILHLQVAPEIDVIKNCQTVLSGTQLDNFASSKLGIEFNEHTNALRVGRSLAPWTV
jgi:hypothetical protein